MRSSTPRRGFTLVELLVVIAIIATLAAILTPAVMIALDSAYKARIKLEVTKITQSLEDYKNKHNDYPPDFSEPATVKRHFRKAFPKMGRDELILLDYITDPDNVQIDRAEALFFALHGYSSDITHPLSGPGGPLDATEFDSSGQVTTLGGSTGLVNSLITFNESKIAWELSGTSYLSNDDGDVFPTYKQEGTETPFVYFDSRSYVYTDSSGNLTVNTYRDPNNSLAGVAQPYKLSEPIPKPNGSEAAIWNDLPSGDNPNTLKFASANKYQIVSAGPDGKFSPLGVEEKDARVFPTGINYKTEDNDNVVNFNTASTLEGDLP